MDVEFQLNDAASRIAAAIGEPARARMLYCLMDNRARTGTELAVVADVSPSTASVHLNRLKTERLVKLLVQGRHRYYSLEGPAVARVLEGLSVLAGASRSKFVPGTPNRLCAARTCYDHIAGTLGVSLHDRFQKLGWLTAGAHRSDFSCELTTAGMRGFAGLGINVEETRTLRRRFAFACLDWSERRFHLGGAMGAAFLRLALQRKWVSQELDNRALRFTRAGQREMQNRLGLVWNCGADSGNSSGVSSCHNG